MVLAEGPAAEVHGEVLKAHVGPSRKMIRPPGSHSPLAGYVTWHFDLGRARGAEEFANYGGDPPEFVSILRSIAVVQRHPDVRRRTYYVIKYCSIGIPT